MVMQVVGLEGEGGNGRVAGAAGYCMKITGSEDLEKVRALVKLCSQELF